MAKIYTQKSKSSERKTTTHTYQRHCRLLISWEIWTNTASTHVVHCDIHFHQYLRLTHHVYHSTNPCCPLWYTSFISIYVYDIKLQQYFPWTHVSNIKKRECPSKLYSTIFIWFRFCFFVGFCFTYYYTRAWRTTRQTTQTHSTKTHRTNKSLISVFCHHSAVSNCAIGAAVALQCRGGEAPSAGQVTRLYAIKQIEGHQRCGTLKTLSGLINLNRVRAEVSAAITTQRHAKLARRVQMVWRYRLCC